MAIDDKRLIVSDFDFDDVKSNLKLFLEAQEEFTDYDLMPPEDQRHARVPKGKKYPERRAGIINTKALV